MAVGGATYPFVVYATIPHLPPSTFVLAALVLILLRWVVCRSGERRRWLPALVCVSLLLLALWAFDPAIAVRAYPVATSLAFAGVFGASLIWPPAAITQIARLRDPHLSKEAAVYTRRLTAVWFAFLLANAAAAAAVGIWGSLEVWTLWNGLISYLLIGTLYFGEVAWRHLVLHRL